jgi:arsenical pump membrane protein
MWQHWPLGVVASVGALGLVALDRGATEPTWRGPWADVPWALLPLFAGLPLLVTGIRRSGALAPLEQAIVALADAGAGGLPVATFGMAVVANVLNNLPAALWAGRRWGVWRPARAAMT